MCARTQRSKNRRITRDVSKETLLKFQQEISLKFPEISNGIFLEISRKFQKLGENHEISDILEISEISKKFQGNFKEYLNLMHFKVCLCLLSVFIFTCLSIIIIIEDEHYRNDENRKMQGAN